LESLRFRYKSLYIYRQIISLKDGGELALDWLNPDENNIEAPLVLVLPGLTGNSQAEYIKSLMSAAQSEGLRCVVLNNRGLGGVDLKVINRLIFNRYSKTEEFFASVDAKNLLRC
jgi:predicted alpha/beta-fold hydrolase